MRVIKKFLIPAIVDAAVIGVPDPRWGETGAAYVVMRPGFVTDEQEVISWCERQLAKFKVPHYVRFVAVVPCSS